MGSGSRYDWAQASADPDPVADLGYAQTEWDVIRTKRRGTCHVLFLPQDEDLLQHEAFVIAEESAVTDVCDHR